MKLNALILLTFVCLCSISKSEKTCSCGKFSVAKRDANENARIYNGRDAKDGQYPWYIFLKIVDKKCPNDVCNSCGGSLISKKHILTAAHCFFDLKTHKKLIGYKGYAYAAVTKMSTKLEPKEFRQLIEFSYKNVKLYPKFKITDNFFDLDVALIELPKRQSFDFDPELNVNSICLPNNIDKLNEKMTMAGFGNINPKEETPEKLQYADKVKKIASNKCYKKASGKNVLPKNWNAMQNKGFCVVRMTKQVSSCDGDSGGPLMWHEDPKSRVYLMGIIRSNSNYRKKCGKEPKNKFFFTIATKVPGKVMNWVKSLIHPEIKQCLSLN